MSPDRLPDFFQCCGQIMEVGKEVRIYRELVFFVNDLDFDRFTEVHGCGSLDVQDYGVGNSDLIERSLVNPCVRQVRGSNLDAISAVLGFEDDLLDGLDPLIAAGNGISGESHGLLTGADSKFLLANWFT